MKKYLKILAVIFIFQFTKGYSQQECLNFSFLPIPGDTYVISAWVKDETISQPITYSGKIVVTDLSLSDTTIHEFLPTGPIIDGWQQIMGEFKLQTAPDNIEIQLISANAGTNISYFDDIRIFPYNGNLKSFVYDPVTQRLMAELDENNYATLYEYDKEGGLIRVKKETERGIYTIQETRSGNSKLNSPQ